MEWVNSDFLPETHTGFAYKITLVKTGATVGSAPQPEEQRLMTQRKRTMRRTLTN